MCVGGGVHAHWKIVTGMFKELLTKYFNQVNKKNLFIDFLKNDTWLE